jgi:predicted O-linked N-acetylglucosamine transferase (SPINDLY family)
MVNIFPYKPLIEAAEESYLKKDYAAAKNNLFKIIQSQPRDSKANELLGLIYLEENRVSDSTECLRISADDKNCSPISLYKLASIYAQTENYHLSIKYLKRLFEKDRNSLEIALEIASLYVVTEQYRELLVWLNTANKISPNHKEILYNIGRAYDQIFDTINAITFYEDAIKVDKNFIEPIFNIGTIYSGQKKYRLALEYFIRAYELDASYDYLLGDIIFSLKNLCMWPMEAEYIQIFNHTSQANGNLAIPFQYLSMDDSPAKQLEIARNFSLNKYQGIASTDLAISQKNCERLKIAYVSSDFRTHAMAFLTTQLFEYHDKSRFELYAVSLFPLTHDDPWTLRLKDTFEHFIDASSKSDDELVQMMRSFGIDIAIDLMGYTALSRTMIFCKRVAPIQINFLGYPGTMGAQFIDYIVADKFLVPPEYRECYTENIIYMPDTFQPNDNSKIISQKILSRAQLGLPDAGFVFCCFNSIYKINKEIFYAWIDILKSVPNSVLWL